MKRTETLRSQGPEAIGDDEHRLQALIDAVGDAYYDWHIGTDFMDFSEQMDRLVGLRPGQMLRTLSAWEERLHPDDRDQVMQRVMATARNGGLYLDQYRLRREDGSFVLVEDRACTLAGADGSLRNLVGTVRDVSEGRLAALEQRIEHEHLEELREALKASRAALEEKAAALTDANTALRVMMDQRDADRRVLEERMATNMRELVLPIVDRLRHLLGSRPEAQHIDALWATLIDVTQSLGPIDSIGLTSGRFTKREIEVANLVRLGRTTAEIADALHLDAATVSFHRGNIRRKLGLSGHGPRLDTYLSERAHRAGDVV